MEIPASTMFRTPSVYTYSALSFVLSWIALGPVSSLESISVLLSLLLLYFPVLLRENKARRSALLVLALSTGRCLAWSRPSLTALSEPVTSTILSLTLSMVTTLLALLPIWAYTWARTRLPQGPIQIVVFPALWATNWWFISHISPIGYLAFWSPNALPSHRWLLQLLGPSSLDWITAAWAVVLSRLLELWLMAPENEDDDDSRQKTDHTVLSAFLLLLLAVPSFFTLDLPNAISLSTATPLKVGCISPARYNRRHTLTIEDYIEETKQYASLAQILLWPEGAVAFHDEAERNASFAKIQLAMNSTVGYVGISFIETVREAAKQVKRNGIAVLTRHDVKLVYYKQNLVPIAESFSLQRSRDPPTVFTIELKAPKGTNKTEWPSPRRIPLTVSICLDFAMPSPFSALTLKPALILGPARTWERSVGYMMWRQVVQRAYEIDSTILWCDGEEGVSGIAGRGYDQVGEGSWFKEIGVPHPLDERPTVYARFPWAWIGVELALCCLGLYFSRGRNETVRTADLIG